LQALLPLLLLAVLRQQVVVFVHLFSRGCNYQRRLQCLQYASSVGVRSARDTRCWCACAVAGLVRVSPAASWFCAAPQLSFGAWDEWDDEKANSGFWFAWQEDGAERDQGQYVGGRR
jgi:hypothetical protein